MNELTFSLSGMENKVRQLVTSGCPSREVAGFVLDTIASVVLRATRKAQEQWPGLPVLCSGGVASNRRLRQVMEQECGALFAKPQYSTDNAMGTAILTWRAWQEGTVL